MGKGRELLRNAFEDGQLLAITQGNIINDVASRTKRLGVVELRRYRYRVQAGEMFAANGLRITSTIGFQAHDKSGFAAFVISCDGNIYLFNHLNKSDRIAHSSFVGQFAKGAGELVMARGKIKLINAHSGHFRPGALNMYHTVQFFLSRGLLATDARVSFPSPPFSELTRAALPYTSHVPIRIILDAQEREMLLEMPERLRELDNELQRLRDSLDSEAKASVYRDMETRKITEELREIEGKILAEEFALAFEDTGPGNDHHVVALSILEGQQRTVASALSRLEGMDIAAVRKEIAAAIRGVKARIEDQADLYAALIDKQEDRLQVVYEYKPFMEYVQSNFQAIRACVRPAFHSI